MKKYIIKWHSEYTAYQSQGNPLDEETAVAWVVYMNRKWPGIFHWLEPFNLPTISARIPVVVLVVVMLLIVILASIGR